MKTKLFTKNAYVAMLMSLVLAFGVQGTADAVSVSFTTTTLEDSTAREHNGGIPDITFTPTLEDDSKTETIKVTASGIQLTSPAFARSITYSDRSGSTHLIDGSAITISGYLTATTGKATVKIEYMDIKDPDTTTDTALGRIIRTYTYYVVKSDGVISETASISLLGLTTVRNGYGYGYKTGVTGRQDFVLHNADQSHYPVSYSVDAVNAQTPDGIPYIYVDTVNNTTQTVTRERSNLAATDVISSAIKVHLDANGVAGFGNGHTNIVTVKIGNTADSEVSEFKAAYIFGTPTLDINLSDTAGGNAADGTTTTISSAFGNGVIAAANDVTGKYSFTGGTGATHAVAGDDVGRITVTVTDGNSNTIEDVVVKFDLVDTSVRAGYLKYVTLTQAVNAANRVLTSPQTLNREVYVRTNSSGQAQVDYQFGTASGKQRMTISTLNLKSKEVTAELGSSAATNQISIETNERQPGNSKKYDLVALVEKDGEPQSAVVVTFRTNNGELERVSAAPAADAINFKGIKNVVTNSNGEAHVVYDIEDNTGRQEIHASIGDDTDNRQEATFVVNGPAQRTTTTTTDETTTTSRTITVSPTSLSGEAGDVVSFRVSGIGATAFTVTGNAAFTSAGGLFTETGLTRTVRLPDTVGTTYSLTVSAISATGYDPVTVPVTVTAAAAPAAPSSGTLTITAVGARSGNQQAIRVSASPTPTSALVVTLTGVTNPTRLTIPANSSSRTVAATLINASAAQIVTATATNYDTGTVTIPAVTPATAGRDTSTTAPPAVVTGGSPSRITISGLSAHSGTVNQPLESPLSVRVVDANGGGVANAKVIFRVTGSGQGRLSQRGNGRAIPKETDRSGYARANFTPLGSGVITVEAEARGVSERVTFTITTGSVPPAQGDSTPSTTTRVSPVVNASVGASSRPPLLWVSGGKIYALVGEDVKAFIPSVENAISLAVGGGKLYWTEQTSETHGTLNSANLDGTDAKQLRTVWGVPRGITVDPTGSKLYWVDAADRLQRSDLDGSDIQNVLRNLSEPKDVALSGGNAYWIGNGSGTDTLSFINLSDPKKEIHPIAATSGIYGGLTIVGRKLYWTEQVSDTHGTLHSANLDGTGAKELRDEPIWGAPIGIAVDTARSRLYWTDAVGRLQRSNLDGSRIQNVAKGLGRLGDIVLSNSIAEPAQTPATKPTPTASKSKYDLNGDGVVDNTDAGLVSEALNTTNAKYDVNDDGVVNFLDLLLVFDNRDADAAGAPPLLGMKLTATQIGIIEEQIDLLIATGDRSPAAMRTLIYLQQLIVMARPEKTQLLANYPNPFNPETWIPYELATDTDVRITIYNAQGVVIRTLQLGQQAAGYYTDRERAAYWDGRNALGEQVASGIYFYQLETDEMSTMRKMVILK